MKFEDLKLGDNLSKNSIYQYRGNFKNLSELVDGNFDRTVSDVLSRISGSNFSSSTKRALCNMYKKVLNAQGKEVDTSIRSLELELNDQYKHEASEKEVKIEWKDVLGVRDVLRKLFTMLSLKDIMYVRDPSRPNKLFMKIMGQAIIMEYYVDFVDRLNFNYTYCDPEVDTENNVYWKGKFYLRQYKTFGQYGKVSFEAPPELKKMLSRYQKKFDVKEGEFILGGKPLQRSNIYDRLVEIFREYWDDSDDVKISSTALRRSYLTDKYAENLEERQTDAKKMHHSTGTQNLYIGKRKLKPLAVSE